MTRYTLHADGSLSDDAGSPFVASEINDTHIHVPHLAPHVIPFQMPKGDVIGIKTIYLSHCWSETFDPSKHDPCPMIIRDGQRLRVFDRVRYGESMTLGPLLANLASSRVYWTPSDRNFGVYNASTIVNGTAYTAYFTLSKDRGRLNGVRHSVTLRVESAYHAAQPSKGMKIKAAAAIDAVITNKKLVYRA